MADSKVSALTALDPIIGEDLLYAVDNPGGTPVERKVTLDVVKAFIAWPEVLHVRQEETSGTQGGASTSSTWHTRILNTEVVNEIAGASLATDQITLPAGTYRIRASAPAIDCDSSKAGLYNVTDAGFELIGNNVFSASTDTSGVMALVVGQFTIAGEKDFELRHWIQTGAGTNGLGPTSTDAEIEVYADVWIERMPD